MVLQKNKKVEICNTQFNFKQILVNNNNNNNKFKMVSNLICKINSKIIN